MRGGGKTAQGPLPKKGGGPSEVLHDKGGEGERGKLQDNPQGKIKLHPGAMGEFTDLGGKKKWDGLDRGVGGIFTSGADCRGGTKKSPLG